MATILGIDLGTTNSSCAFYDGREVVLVPNERGSRTTPSVAALADDGAVLVGESAKNQALLHPERTVIRSKRLMGSPKRLPFGPRSLAPEEAASLILARLKADAEAYLGAEVREAVITVPAYFSEAQRRATREAGRLAGLEVRRLLNEPTAAAIAWAWASNRTYGEDASKRSVLVYDLGGGTFDATVLAMKGSECRVLSACGDNELGGADFDTDLLERAFCYFEEEWGLTSLRSDQVLAQQLAELVERAKMELSAREYAVLALPFAGGTARGTHPSWRIERAEFEALIRARIDRTLALTKQALSEAGVAPDGVDRLVLSGGSSRIPLVRRLLKEELGRDAEARVNPEEIVAFGAAVFAGLGSGEGELKVTDALSRSFGLEIDGDEFITVVPKNSPVPLSRKRTFTTIADDQSSVEIHVLQGESAKASENLSLGRFLLSGIRAGKKGEPRIEVEFSIDPDEILHVRARDLETGVAHAVTIAASSANADGVGAERLRSLASRADALKAAAGGDRSLLSELEDALALARRLADSLEADGGDGAAKSASAGAALALEAIVAELEARKAAHGG